MGSSTLARRWPPEIRTALSGAPASVAGAARGLSIAIYMHDLSGGGVERQNLALAREFRAAGHRPTLVLHSLDGECGELLPRDVPIVILGGRRTLADIPRLMGYIRRTRPDILMASLDFNNVASLIARAVTGGPTKLVICQHNMLASEALGGQSWNHRLVPLGYSLLSAAASGVIAVSRGVAEDICARTTIRREAVEVIYNPVIGPDFDRLAAAGADHPWFDEPGPPVFVSAGRLVPQKDHATLIRAFARHVARRDARLVLLGKGPLRAVLEALARELGVADRVAFLGFRENPLPYFRGAAAFVLPSRFEGFGNVLVEAMGCGTPVIATDCPSGPREILADGRLGLLVPPGDVQAMAEALRTDLRRLWPAQALRARAAEFTHGRCAAAYLRLFGAMVAGAGG